MMKTSNLNSDPKYKICSSCGEKKQLHEFLKRTGRRERQSNRRGTCRACRQEDSSTKQRLHGVEPTLNMAVSTARTKHLRKKRKAVHHRSRASQDRAPSSVSQLRTNAQGVVRMRGRSDTGGRWYQEIDLEQAKVLVLEGAATMINRYTIKRLYSNKEFKRFILNRDQHTCHYCGQYGDTIDHLVPRAKGGYTTPANCVCACFVCNQKKGNKTLKQFESFHSP